MGVQRCHHFNHLVLISIREDLFLNFEGLEVAQKIDKLLKFCNLQRLF